MSALLDHLTAVVAGTFLIGALAVFQYQSSADATEAADQARTTAFSGTLLSTLERELENVRGRPQTEQAFAPVAGALGFGADAYRFRMARATTADGTEYTRQLAFPTLADPSAGPGSEIHIVSYAVAPTGETARVDGRDRPLLRATRAVFARGGPLRETATFEGLVDFDVTVYGAGGAETTATDELRWLPSRIRIAFEHAPESGADASSTRQARTVRVPGAGASALVAVATDRPGGIPDLPGDPAYDPTREPTPTRDWARPDRPVDTAPPDWGPTGRDPAPGTTPGPDTGAPDRPETPAETDPCRFDHGNAVARDAVCSSGAPTER